MENLLTALTSLLSEEIALHEGLKSDLALEAEQDGKLTAGEFLKLQQRKYHWAHQIGELEARRIDQVDALAQCWSEDPRQLTLRSIIARATSPHDEALQGCYKALRALVDEVRHLAGETGANAQARLKAIDATLAIIGEAARIHPTYSDAGRLLQRKPTFKDTTA